MTGDWNAVAKVVDRRIREIGVSQRELAQRSQVSQAVIREIQYNTVQRRRSTRTLEALSQVLDLHPDHLTAVLEGTNPSPREPEPTAPPGADPRAELDAMDLHLMAIYRRLDEILAAINTHRPRDAQP
ncbi:helix-turn-helix domain-containing protein [Actinokineospora diospyrosa]|uniref:Helix-turn-helix protein n=1 Tax=Actinokineospora diospyrosa TaxID=103728 RepID=A0ABT1IE12_9PSEU|nr:helix-turn-helix transcriptional regulator [Actinokineospora diospyrosa]MCP2270862.1 hypothetical protein [Actinokineospora diospyrosa]